MVSVNLLKSLDIRDGFKKFYIYVGSGAYQKPHVENSKPVPSPQLYIPNLCLNPVEFANIGSIDRKGETFSHIRSYQHEVPSLHQFTMH